MSGSSNKPLPKKLAKPRPKPRNVFGGLLAIGEREVIDRELLGLLLKHYGIKDETEDRWYQLSLTLAREHIPAFRQESRGRGRSWSHLDEAELYLEVQILATREFGGNESKACRELIKEPPYSKMSIEPRSLYSRYQRTKTKNPMVVHLIEKQRQAEAKAKHQALVNALRGCDEKKA